MSKASHTLRTDVVGSCIQLEFADTQLYRACKGIVPSCRRRASAVIRVAKGCGRDLNMVGYQGVFDPSAGRGWVRVHPRWPRETLLNFLRYAALRNVVNDGGIVLHAACVARKGKAYIFFGRSGAGKSTVSRLSKGMIVANDDKTAVFEKNGHYVAWGLPAFRDGKSGAAIRRGPYPVKALFELVQDKQIYLEPMPVSLAVARLLALPLERRTGIDHDRWIRRVARLARAVPRGHLHFRKDARFWRCIDAWDSEG